MPSVIAAFIVRSSGTVQLRGTGPDGTRRLMNCGSRLTAYDTSPTLPLGRWDPPHVYIGCGELEEGDADNSWPAGSDSAPEQQAMDRARIVTNTRHWQ